MSDACSGFRHGRTECWDCHPPGTSWHGEPRLSVDGRGYEWSLRRNPAYWGSAAPEVLVLGFSKGPDQQEGIDDFLAGEKTFQQIAFDSGRGRMRKRLQDMLASLDLWSPKKGPFDKAFNSGLGRFGFASLVRCSVAMKPPGADKFVGSGDDILVNAITSGEDFVGKCIERHLTTLPPSVRLVLMLGIAVDYVHACRGYLTGRALPGQEAPYAYDVGAVRFAHIPHPSGHNNGRVETFCLRKDPGEKEDSARACRWPAVEQVLASGLGSPLREHEDPASRRTSPPPPEPTTRIIKPNALPERVRQRFERA